MFLRYSMCDGKTLRVQLLRYFKQNTSYKSFMFYHSTIFIGFNLKTAVPSYNNSSLKKNVIF